MNEKNQDYLKTSLKYLGFGDKLNGVLENAIKQELPFFKLGLNNTVAPAGVSQDNKSQHDHIRYELNFSKGKDSDMYFLNNYHAILNKPGLLAREHTFNLSQNNWITVREAYNLLSGRSVNKDLVKEGALEKVNVWTKLDLEVKDARGNFPSRYFYPNFGYDLEKTISKYPVKELENPEKKADLLASLKKGDLVSSELLLQGKKAKIFVAANPEMKTVNLYDNKHQTIRDYHIWPELAKEKNTNRSVEGKLSESEGKAVGRAVKNAHEQSNASWKQDNIEEAKSRTMSR